MTDAAPTPAPVVDLARPWSCRSHAELAELARELLLAGHLIDRSGMPHLIARFGRDGMAQVAIDEWMAASPIYTKRMQRLLGFEGDTVEVIFKGMQLDVGAPPEFMDFRYTVHDDLHGEFHLDHCGALMDVEPMGEDYVQAMCHDIEDPTFDATATATNPRAQVRPIHRPPRVPADRAPHCAWTVEIVPDAEPLPFPPQAEHLSRSEAARLPLAAVDPDLPAGDGWADYAGPLDPDLVMERFSSAALATIADETCLQGHLLSRAYLLEVAERANGTEAAEMGGKQLTGIAGVTTKRLGALLDAPPDLDGIAAVLAVHPMLLPRSYVDLRLERCPGGGALTVSIGPCPATNEDDGLTWPAILVGGDDAGLAAAVQCLAPLARIERIDRQGDAVASWRIWMDPVGEPARQPDEVTLTEFSTGVDFHFARRT
ncbi:MAG TPA: hypothetical protein VNS19_06270 [Acidimicrobiales bacterium]|nr:hypothetical protein [Acidimicrobiales bacterium]